MIYPDELPAWLWIPATILLWSTWIGICVADARARVARILHDPNHNEQERR